MVYLFLGEERFTPVFRLVSKPLYSMVSTDNTRGQYKHTNLPILV